MEQIIMTKPNGNSFPLLSKRGIINVKSATQNMALLGEDVVNISVESTKKQNYEIGDTITIFGRTYKMNQLPKMQKTGPHSFSYDLVFEGVQYDLIRATYDLTIDTTNNQLQDFQANTLTGDLRRFTEVLLANVARVFPQKWELGNCPETANDKTLTFGESDNCLLVLQNLCKEFGTEFYIDQKSGKNIVHFGKVGQIFPHSFSYGKGKGIYKLERQNVSSSNIITRLKVYGSTKNITNKYRANRLCLPNKSKQQSYIENPEMIAKYGIWEATKHFEDIAPTRIGTITGVVQGNVLKFVDTQMFDLNEKEADGQTTKYLLPGTTAKIHFNTGNLAGYQFDVQSYDHATRTFTIKKLTDERNDSFPNASSAAFQFAIGDKYKLIDIALPPEFEQQAEQDLLQTGQKYYEQNSQPKVQYALSVSEDFIKRKLAGDGILRNVFSVGDYIPIVDEDIDVNKSIRIQSFQRDVFKPYQYTLTISDSVSTSIVNRIISDLIEVDKVVQINQLQDPIKAKRGWRDSQEIFNKVFDNEGYFDVERIKPLSIETGMINVGSRMQQFSLPNVILSVENNNTSVRNTAGQLVHLTIEDTPRTWQIPESVQTNIDADFHYIYVRAWRIGSMASIYISKEQIKVDAEVGYYYFLAGSLGSIENGFRRIKTTYGFTQINPFEITTGRIAPPSGNHYIELLHDRINIVGNLHITDGNINQIKQSISPDLLSLENRVKAFSEQKVNDLQVGGRNLAKNSKIQTGKGTNKASQELLKVNAYILSEPQIRQQIYTVSFWAKATGSQKRFRPFISGTQGIGTFNLTEDFAYYKATYTAVTTINHIHFYGTGIENLEVKDFKMEKGTKATDWSPAPEDLQNQITAEQQARQQAINEASLANQNYSNQQSELAKTLAIAHADGKVSEAEQRQIANATQKLQEAKTYAEQKVNALQIGGVNILRGTKEFIIKTEENHLISPWGGSGEIVSERFNSNTVRKINSNWQGFRANITNITNKPVMISFWVKTNSGGKFDNFALRNDPSTSHLAQYMQLSNNGNLISDGQWHRYTMFNPKGMNFGKNVLNGFLEFHQVTGDIFVSSLQIEIGTKVTDWSLNPQDIDKHISDVRTDLETALENARRLLEAEDRNIKSVTQKLEQKTDFINDTKINGNTVATGAVMVGNSLGGNAGINGSGLSTNDVRFWAGSSFANRANAPFRVLDNGEVHATNAHISGDINATRGNIGGFDISYDRLQAGSFNQQGLALSNSGIIFREDPHNTFVGLGNNVMPSTLGVRGLQRLEYTGDSSSAIGLYVKVRPKGNDHFGSTTREALHIDGNYYQKGATAIFEDEYIGQAYSDIIETKIGRTHTYIFTNTSGYINVRLPNANKIQQVAGANVTFELSIVTAWSSNGRVRIQGVEGGHILDNNGNRFGGGNGQIDMEKGDTLRLRYCSGDYYVMNLER